MDTRTTTAIAMFTACLLVSAGVASAQTGASQAGPLVLQPTSDGPVITPDVSFGRFNHQGGTLLGGYGGWLVDNRLLLGGGATFLVDHNFHDSVAGVGYGGFVAGWSVPFGRVVPGIRALVGFGDASFTNTVNVTVPAFPDHPHGEQGEQNPPAGSTVAQQVHFHDGFFVFEPKATVALRLARAVAIDVAGGYRVISGAGTYNSWLRGASVSVGVRFGPHI